MNSFNEDDIKDELYNFFNSADFKEAKEMINDNDELKKLFSKIDVLTNRYTNAFDGNYYHNSYEEFSDVKYQVKHKIRVLKDNNNKLSRAIKLTNEFINEQNNRLDNIMINETVSSIQSNDIKAFNKLINELNKLE